MFLPSLPIGITTRRRWDNVALYVNLESTCETPVRTYVVFWAPQLPVLKACFIPQVIMLLRDMTVRISGF